MPGQIELVLNRRYGVPLAVREKLDTVWNWKSDDPGAKSVLYEPLLPRSRLLYGEAIDRIYGDVRGGFLIQSALKLSLLAGPSIFGLPTIEELHQRPEVRRALQLAHDVVYFMDAANVWFYGVRQDRLVVYDSDPDEFDELGPFEMAFSELLAQWESSG